jgi:hypothetical protein
LTRRSLELLRDSEGTAFYAVFSFNASFVENWSLNIVWLFILEFGYCSSELSSYIVKPLDFVGGEHAVVDADFVNEAVERLSTIEPVQALDIMCGSAIFYSRIHTERHLLRFCP